MSLVGNERVKLTAAWLNTLATAPDRTPAAPDPAVEFAHSGGSRVAPRGRQPSRGAPGGDPRVRLQKRVGQSGKPIRPSLRLVESLCYRLASLAVVCKDRFVLRRPR